MENRDEDKAQMVFIMEASRKSMERVRSQVKRLSEFLEFQALKDSHHEEDDSDGSPGSSSGNGPLGMGTA